MSRRTWRPISSTSSNPRVVIRAPAGSFRSSTAFVAIVVPCSTIEASPSANPHRAAASVIPRMNPIDGSAGVVGTLCAHTAPERASKICRSVKVPPISTAIRTGLSALGAALIPCLSRRNSVQRSFAVSRGGTAMVLRIRAEQVRGEVSHQVHLHYQPAFVHGSGSVVA